MKQKILISDDDTQLLAIMRLMFEGAGYEVAEARDGKEAILIYREKPADLIITDLLMPEMDGFATFTELKKDYPNLKCFGISGGGKLGPDSYLKLAKRMGMLHTFEKPFDCREMLDAVAQTLKEGKTSIKAN